MESNSKSEKHREIEKRPAVGVGRSIFEFTELADVYPYL